MNLTTAQIQAPAHGDAQGHGHGHHDPHLAHHFDTREQQFEADKLGMWVFLVTEILFFSGWFCAYAVYRANHPEIFQYAHLFLNRTLGAVNTVVLLFSSLTMAWGVRCAQLSQPRGLKVCLILTLLCAFAFLGIKYVEYKTKWEEGLLWGAKYHPTKEALEHVEHLAAEHGGAGTHAPASAATTGHAVPAATVVPAGASAAALPATGHAAPSASTPPAVDAAGHAAQTSAPPASAPANAPASATSTTAVAAAPINPDPAHAKHVIQPEHVSIFFSVYFCMTGLHGIHILAGIGLISWLLVRSYRGEFTDGYFTPVDLVGLYWHIVDLVWIYLFPLLYLIH